LVAVITTAVGAARLAASAAFSSGVDVQPASVIAAAAAIIAMRVAIAMPELPLFVMPDLPNPQASATVKFVAATKQ
jgi:hypothetical protein